MNEFLYDLTEKNVQNADCVVRHNVEYVLLKGRDVYVPTESEGTEDGPAEERECLFDKVRGMHRVRRAAVQRGVKGEDHQMRPSTRGQSSIPTDVHVVGKRI